MTYSDEYRSSECATQCSRRGREQDPFEMIMESNSRIDVPLDSCAIALRNVRQALEVERRFPLKIFVGNWSEYLFFDSDWMTAPDFVEHVKTFLDIESGLCACLWNLDADEVNPPAVFFVREHTTADEYRALLAGKTPGFGWLHAMERLTCASDVGEWCMYCEPSNEIAVVAFRHTGASARYSGATSRFHAERIDTAMSDPLSYGFSQVAASPEWRDAFLREYTLSDERQR